MVKAKPKPYATTTVSPSRSQEQIGKMIREHGAVKSNVFYDYEASEVVLAWERKIIVEGAPMVQPLMHRISYKDLKIGQAFRALYWHLKHKFEAVEFGIVTFEEEFLPYFVVKLPSGDLGTIAEYFVPDISHGSLPPMRHLGRLSLKGVEEDQERITKREEQRQGADYEILEDGR